MNLLSGLEQFGIDSEKAKVELFSDTSKKTSTSDDTGKKDPVAQAQSEKDYLFSKYVRCTICQKTFEVKMVKSARVRRLQPDFDLRPRYEGIDTLKYDVYCCPHCGYAAMSRFFEHLTKGQINLVKEQVCANFRPTGEKEPDTYDYETAITRYKLALYNSVVKRAKNSEKAYTCLKIAWLYRDMIDIMPETTADETVKKEEARTLSEEFYKEAFEGFQKAIASEDFPICGMDSFTIDYLMACLAYHFKQYAFASKSISNILSSRAAERRIKDKALELKEFIINEIKKES